MRSIVAALLLVGILVGNSDAQLDDACSSASAVTALPFTASVDVSLATSDPAPPASSCNSSSQNAWFAVRSSTAATILIETPDAGYTSVGVYSGACGSLLELGCDAQSNGAAKVLPPIESGQTLYVTVSGDAGAIPVRITSAPIDATPPTIVGAALTGDASPLGGAFSDFGTSAMLTPELVAFTGTTEGVFADVGNGVQAVAMSGDPAPDGGTFGAVGPPVIDAAGDVFFFATVDGGPASTGIFRRSGSTTTALVRSGDVAPNGVIFKRISRWIGVNDGGDLVFIAGSSRYDDGVYVVTGGVLQGPFLSVSDATPCGTVNRLGSSRSLAINSAGQIATFVQTASPSRRGILRIAGGTVVAAVCEDDPAPGGGTYRTLSDPFALGDPPSSTIVFRATTSAASGRIFRNDAPGIVSIVAAPGDVATGGETITALPTTSIALDASGGVGFVGRIGTHDAVFVRPVGPGAPTTLAGFGSPCPSGESVRSIALDVAGDELGALVVSAACSNSAGVFTVNGGPGLTALATDRTATPIGPGLLFGNAAIRSGRAAMRGSRTAVYQRSCKNGVCGDIQAVAAQYDPVPGIAGDRVWDVDAVSLTGRRGQAVFTAGTLGGREIVLAARHGALLTVASTETPLAGTTFTPTLLRDGGVNVAGPIGLVFGAIGALSNRGLVVPVNGNSILDGCLLSARRGGLESVACTGDLLPGGGTAQDFSEALLVAAAGSRIVAVVQGTSHSGLFALQRSSRADCKRWRVEPLR